MSMLARFKRGDFLFRQDDASDRVLLVKSGEIEIWRNMGTDSVLLGHVRSGEWVGEMGVIEGRSRSASARASEDGEAEVLTAQQFLERVSNDPVLARDLILRLSVRLRDIEDKISGELHSFSHSGSGGPSGPASEPRGENEIAISIAAESAALQASIGAAPIRIARLPFVIGRTPAENETLPSQHPDLSINDYLPFRLSRQHFMIGRTVGGFVAADLGSTLGTLVNGQAIGHYFTKDSAPLHRGENHIVAGGSDSPFKFLVSIG
ncbi:MAG: cyclic nucleotide-binding domain-containing protein [Methylocapsa sp.]|nr:cyclic nucleotide-binding domain-containing protein [Methylocapsa sp.]